MKRFLKQAAHKGKLLIHEIMDRFKGNPIVHLMCIAIKAQLLLADAKIVVCILIYTLQVIVISSELLIQILQICLKVISSVISLFYCGLKVGNIMNYQNCPLFNVKSKRKLSFLLRIPLYKLLNVDKFYLSDSFKHGKRTLTNPRPQLKKILSIITKYLERIGIPSFEFGGVQKKSAIKNVRLHIGNNYVLRTDIQHFFPNTKYNNVYNFFHFQLMMSVDCATILAHLTTDTVLSANHRSLPQGYPSSPLLSLYCYIDLFNELNRFSKNNHLIFSAYYDDITMSSSKFIPYSYLHQVRRIIHKYGFNAHPQKTKLVKIYPLNKKIKITGVLINKTRISVPKGLFKRLHESVNLMTLMLKDTSRSTNANKYEVVHQVRGRIVAIKSIDNSYDFQGYMDHARQLEKTISKTYLIRKSQGLI